MCITFLYGFNYTCDRLLSERTGVMYSCCDYSVIIIRKFFIVCCVASSHGYTTSRGKVYLLHATYNRCNMHSVVVYYVYGVHVYYIFTSIHTGGKDCTILWILVVHVRTFPIVRLTRYTPKPKSQTPTLYACSLVTYRIHISIPVL